MLLFIVNLGMAILVLISSSIQMASTNSTLNQILLALPITIVIFNGQIYSSGLISTYLIEITLNAVAAIGRLSLMVFVSSITRPKIMTFAIPGTQINSMHHLCFHKSMSTTLSQNNYFPSVLLVFPPFLEACFLRCYEKQHSKWCVCWIFSCVKSQIKRKLPFCIFNPFLLLS